MGLELWRSDIAMGELQDGYLSDSAAFSSVAEVLQRVAKSRDMITESDREQYDQLLKIVTPTRKKNLDEEVLLVTALKALTGVVTRISSTFHYSLLNNVFSMWIWNYGLEARNALLELITNLAVVPDKFLENCLDMLVRNFRPPEWLWAHINQPRWHVEKKMIYGQLHEALRAITYLVPLAPFKLKGILDVRMPKHHSKKEEIIYFVECMLGLEIDEVGVYLGNTLLQMVVDLLVDLDVNISWDDILKEDHNKGIFDMELEDLEDNTKHSADGVETSGRKGYDADNGVASKNASKLDALMVIVCEHINSSAHYGCLVKVCETLLESFRKTVLNAYKSKFSQFVMFYACSLDPEICGLKFAILLTDIFVSKAEDPISRMSAVAYLSSYLSRARFISSATVASIVRRLVEWCHDYCNSHSDCKNINPSHHRLFYAGCQAMMYILCFRMRLMMDIPQLRSILFHMPLEEILSHPLDPLKVCLPTIVQEFLRQAKAAYLIKKPILTILQNDLLESEFSKSFGGIERLDMFFPFDPYLLKESDRFMRPNFEFWSMVRKTYNNYNSDEEFEDLDQDSADEAGNDENDDVDVSYGDDDELGHSMNKMSITPRTVYEFGMAQGNIRISSKMPARIRPSVSPM
ncbi:hypothetical protein AXF42_Ash007848 [Apostasia shenzhenica]|uniref:RNA polymerase I-specific transcription initiation factor RRN3 n=1 Tax=Apostasia shenzhenica TaxID=1088818 RepID=A0A2I0B5J4_9ASPA|nr:hypothetical protein AXF42_Ash007848 [Apostasia shenzhenica]